MSRDGIGSVEQHEQGMARLSELVGALYNPRIMPDAEMRNLMQSLREFGFAQPVVARKEDGLILGGHQRVEAMRRIDAEAGGNGNVRVPVVWIAGLSDEKAKLLNVALNRIHGEWDFEKLGELFSTLAPADATSPLVSGFSGKEIEDIIKLTAEDAGHAPNPVIDEVDDAPPPASIGVQKLSFNLTPADAVAVREALTAHGMTNAKTAAAALVRMARAASAHVLCEEELCQ